MKRAKPKPVQDEPVTKGQIAAYQMKMKQRRGYPEATTVDLEAAKARHRARRAGG